MSTTNTTENQSTVQKHYKAVYSHRDVSKLPPYKDANNKEYPAIGKNEIAIDTTKNTLVYGQGGQQYPITAADNTITTAKIQNNAVTTEKIINGAITEVKISDDAISTNKIKNKNITEDKIDDSAISTDKIKAKSITEDKLSDTFSAPKVQGTLTFGTKSYNGSENQEIKASDLGLSSALRFEGKTQQPLCDGYYTATIQLEDGTFLDFNEIEGTGYVVLARQGIISGYNEENQPIINGFTEEYFEFVLVETRNDETVEHSMVRHWEKLGDENSFALKTYRIDVQNGLSGGGTLSGNVTIGINAGGIKNESIAQDAISSVNIQNNAVTTNKINNGAVKKEKLDSIVQGSLDSADNAVQPDTLEENYYNKNYIDKRLQDNRILLNNYYISPTNAISGIRDIGTKQTIEIDLVDSDKNPITNVGNLMIASTNLIDYPNYLFWQAAKGGNGGNPRTYMSEGNKVTMHYNLSVDKVGNRWIKGKARDFRYNYISLKPFKNKTIKVSATFLILNETPNGLMDNNPYIDKEEGHDLMEWIPGSDIDGKTRCYLRVTRLNSNNENIPEWPSSSPTSIWELYDKDSNLKNDGKPSIVEDKPSKEYKQELVHLVQEDNEVLTIWMSETSQGLAIKDFQITLVPTNTGYENFQEPINFKTIFSPLTDENGTEIDGSYQGILPHIDKESGDSFFLNSMYLFEGNNNVVDNDNKILLIVPEKEPVQINKINGCYTNTSTAFELLSNRINELHNLTTTLTLLNP